jgi:hypothetical protein
LGERGPVPKRATDRAGHRSKAELPDVVEAAGVVQVPEPEEHWHPHARDWYLSLARSGQSKYFEPSDWEQARFTAEMMTTVLKSERPSSELVKAVFGGMKELGTSEAARRRMRIEVERNPAEKSGASGDDAKAAVMERYRQAAADG